RTGQESPAYLIFENSTSPGIVLCLRLEYLLQGGKSDMRLCLACATIIKPLQYMCASHVIAHCCGSPSKNGTSTGHLLMNACASPRLWNHTNPAEGIVPRFVLHATIHH